jgi:hypothetical protein
MNHIKDKRGKKRKPREKLYVIDWHDGQIMCLSGNSHFFLIEVTSDYRKKSPNKNKEVK